jgi:hypothetical protein
MTGRRRHNASPQTGTRPAVPLHRNAPVPQPRRGRSPFTFPDRALQLNNEGEHRVMADDEGPLDTSRPDMARVCDYWLGGHCNFTADRDAGRKIDELWPGSGEKVREGRRFVTRAVTWAARQGIAQYLVAEPGMPARPEIHETARVIVPDARAAYVHLDRYVLAYFRANTAGDPGVAAVEAAPRVPEKAAAHPGVRAVIRRDEPVCVVWALAAQFVPGDAAREVIAGYARLLAPGSCIVISLAVPVDEQAAELASVLGKATGDRVYPHTAEGIAGWLDGLDVIMPGVADVRSWRAGMPEPRLAPRPVFRVLGAVTRI